MQIALFIIGIAVACTQLAVAETRFVQDRFVIGLWNPPATQESLDARYQEIAV